MQWWLVESHCATLRALAVWSTVSNHCNSSYHWLITSILFDSSSAMENPVSGAYGHLCQEASRAYGHFPQSFSSRPARADNIGLKEIQSQIRFLCFCIQSRILNNFPRPTGVEPWKQGHCWPLLYLWHQVVLIARLYCLTQELRKRRIIGTSSRCSRTCEQLLGMPD